VGLTRLGQNKKKMSMVLPQTTKGLTNYFVIFLRFCRRRSTASKILGNTSYATKRVNPRLNIRNFGQKSKNIKDFTTLVNYALLPDFYYSRQLFFIFSGPKSNAPKYLLLARGVLEFESTSSPPVIRGGTTVIAPIIKQIKYRPFQH